MNRTKLVMTAAMLAVVSIIFQYFIFLPSETGMRIDLVAVPWVLAAFLLGPLGGAITSIASYVVIALTAPTGWVGATIKLAASAPLVIAFAVLSLRKPAPSKMLLGGALAAAIVVRVILAHAVNAAFVFPMFGIPVEATVNEVFFFLKLSQEVSWLAVLDVLNVVQSLIEFAVCYVLLFHTRLRERLHAQP